MAQSSRSAFPDCKFCHGRGCLACEGERKRTEQAAAQEPKPIFTARFDNPQDMELLKRTFGSEAMEHAFGPNGGGMREIELNAAVASFIQAVQQSQRRQEPPSHDQSHNEMVEVCDADGNFLHWKCAICGYVYGTSSKEVACS